MKNLANCKPTEFFAQAYKTKKAAEKWMKSMGVFEIRNRKPDLVKITQEMTPEEKKKLNDEMHNLLNELQAGITDGVLDITVKADKDC